MPSPSRAVLAAAALTAAACHSYEPEPVDLAAHANVFAERRPADAVAMQTAARGPYHRIPDGAIDLTNGLDRHEGRLVAMCFHPDCRAARSAASGAAIDRFYADQVADPELSFDVLRILESVPHQWLASASLGFTIPWQGRLGLQRALGDVQLGEAMLAALRSEAAAADALDEAWIRWSADCSRRDLLQQLGDDLRALASIAERLAAAGAITNLGARVFTLELLRKEHELATATDAAARGELECKALLGLHPAAPVTLVPTLVLAPRVPEPAARSASLHDSPRVAAALQQHRVAEAELALAVRRQWPDLVLGPTYAEEDAQPRFGLGFVLPIPLFSGNDAAIARAGVAREAAADALRAALEVATQELALAELQLLQAARQQQFVQERLVPLASRQLRDGKVLADAGQLDPLLLLDAHVRVHDTSLMVVAADERLALAAVAVNRRTAMPGLAPAEPNGDSR